MQGNTEQETFRLQDAYVGNTEDVSGCSWMFKSSIDTVKFLNVMSEELNGGVGGSHFLLRPEEEVTFVHHPVDVRSARERKQGRRRYKKAQKHYGKTYTVTQGQLLGALAVTLGTIMLLSVLLFHCYIKFAQITGAI